VVNRREAIKVSVQCLALEYGAGKLALTDDFDQAGLLQLFKEKYDRPRHSHSQ
jgi:hypothetical protein